jgi:hypothetical protein
MSNCVAILAEDFARYLLELLQNSKFSSLKGNVSRREIEFKKILKAG